MLYKKLAESRTESRTKIQKLYIFLLKIYKHTIKSIV